MESSKIPTETPCLTTARAQVRKPVVGKQGKSHDTMRVLGLVLDQMADQLHGKKFLAKEVHDWGLENIPECRAFAWSTVGVGRALAHHEKIRSLFKSRDGTVFEITP